MFMFYVVGAEDLKKVSSTLTALYNEKVKLQKVCCNALCVILISAEILTLIYYYFEVLRTTIDRVLK